MLKVGLTGGIGSGKTTVAKVFELLGVSVYYADTQAQHLIEHNQDIRKSIISLLGPEAYGDTGLPDKKFIATQVFGDQALLHQLNGIVHPAVRKDFMDWCSSHAGEAYLLQEAAILFESGGAAFLDAVILVWAPEDLRIDRVMQRDESSQEEVQARIRNQMPDMQKVKRSQYIINNDGEHALIKQVMDIHAAIYHQSTIAPVTIP